jgi:hypothetical protein
MLTHDAEKLFGAFCVACLALGCAGSVPIGGNGTDASSNGAGAEGGSSGSTSSGSGSSSGSTSSSGSSGSSGAGSTSSSGSTSSGSGSSSGAGSSGGGGSDSGSSSGSVDGGSGSGHCVSTSCPSSELCVQAQVGGGVVVFPDDAGVCPADRELGATGRCDYIPTYRCVQRPAACMGGVSCACASTLCPQSFMCLSSASTTFLSCLEAVP